MIRKGHDQAADCFDQIKRIRDIGELRAKLSEDRDNPENQRQNDQIAAE
jgi:tRNA-dihydrouridine synthase C